MDDDLRDTLALILRNQAAIMWALEPLLIEHQPGQAGQRIAQLYRRGRETAEALERLKSPSGEPGK